MAYVLHQIRNDFRARVWSILTVALLASAIPAGALFAAGGNTPSLDEQLNIPGATTAPSSHGGSSRTSGGGGGAAGDAQGLHIDPGVARRLEGGQTGDLLRQALTEMSEASDRLEHARDAGEDTQRVQESVLRIQESVVAKLDQFITNVEEQRQQQSQSSGSQSNSQSSEKQRQENGSKQNQAQQPSSPGNTPGQKPQQGDSQQASSTKGENRGQNQIPPGGVSATMPGQLSQNRSEWGNLPARVRDQLQEGLKEPYSPIYREMTEQYYRALAEQGR